MKLNRNGSSVITGILFLLLTALLIIAVAIAFWAYSGRQHYKNDTSAIVNSAVQKAYVAQHSKDEASFELEQNSDLASYSGPPAYGTITVKYPKYWSAYINTASSSDSSSYPLDAYFMPNYLSSVTDDGTTDFALRLQVESSSYNQILQQYDQTSEITVSPYALPKVPSDVGVKITGTLQSNISGTMVILPLRSQAIEIWTEGNTYLSVFNTIILPNLTFSP